MRYHVLTLLLLRTAVPSLADVVSYEATSFPEDDGWDHSTFCTPERLLETGWFHQRVDPGECFAPPEGDQDVYFRSIEEFDGVPTFFLEWRIQADGDRSELPWGAPAVIAAGSLGPVDYWFGISRDQVKFTRDIDLPVILFIDIAPEAPHTYRLELYGDTRYAWYIDGEMVHTDVPGGSFPADTPSIAWRARSAFLESAVKWDYIRYGTIPIDGSGDYDSDGQVDGGDFYYFDECFLGSNVDAGPGCRFADFDFDTDVDCDDWDAFTLAWTAPDNPPIFTPCATPPPPVPTASTLATALLTLVLLTAGATALARRTACRSC